MGTVVRPAKTSPDRWDACVNVDHFVDEVLAELSAMAKDGCAADAIGPRPRLAGATLRKAVLAIWCVYFCGMQWRAIGLLCDIPFGGRSTDYSLAGPGPASGAGCWMGCAAPGGVPAGMLQNQVRWYPIADPVARQRAALLMVSTAERRSEASRSISPSTNRAFRWRSMSRQRTGMTQSHCSGSARTRRWGLQGPSARGSWVPGRAVGQSRRDARHYRRGDRPRP